MTRRREAEEAEPARDPIRVRSSDLEHRLVRLRSAWDLTARQVEVLRCLVAGDGNKQIARGLECSVKNIEVHVSNLLQKTTCRNRAGLVARFWTS